MGLTRKSASLLLLIAVISALGAGLKAAAINETLFLRNLQNSNGNVCPISNVSTCDGIKYDTSWHVQDANLDLIKSEMLALRKQAKR
jgi:hypothetical protein